MMLKRANLATVAEDNNVILTLKYPFLLKWNGGIVKSHLSFLIKWITVNYRRLGDYTHLKCMAVVFCKRQYAPVININSISGENFIRAVHVLHSATVQKLSWNNDTLHAMHKVVCVAWQFSKGGKWIVVEISGFLCCFHKKIKALVEGGRLESTTRVQNVAPPSQS